MEDLPDTSTRRPKRKATKSSANRKDRNRTSDASDQSPNKVAREGSPDDIEEVRPTKQGRALEATAASIQRPELSLIKAIKGNGKSIPQLVKCWVERYAKNAQPAMAELLTTLFQACGAKHHHQGESLDNVDDVVSSLVQLAMREEVEVYQSSKSKELKNFKKNLVSFWDDLVVECQNGPLFDKVLFNKCMDYIISLSRTSPRVYRQVASLIGLQLVTSFISVAKSLRTQRDTAQTQLNAEKKKRIEGPRVDSLKKRLSTTDENVTDLEQMMLNIFTELFVCRSRDIDPTIRILCIQYLGVWILSYPSVFLKDHRLKYLGRALNDKSADVRKASVLALQKLYEVDDYVVFLELITEEYSERMIELFDDIDVSVAVCAIGLVKQLLRHQLLPDADLHRLYRLLIADPPEIRCAIGELVYDHLISKGNDSESSEAHLKRMLEILRAFSADPIFSIYVIDDVWEYMKAMKDWKCIISMLSGYSPDLSDEDKTNLIRLLFASAKKAVGERIVPASDNRKRYDNKAQKDVLENNRRDLTNAMMEEYPSLLRLFMADKAKVPYLVEIIVYMNLELCSLERKEQKFKDALQLIKEAFFQHEEKDALRSCVKSFKFCSTESPGHLQDFVHSYLKGVEDDLIAKLKSAIEGAMGDDDNYALLVNLKRLYELQLSYAVVPTGFLYDDTWMNLCDLRNLDEEVVGFLLLNMYLHLAWSVHSITYSKTVSEASLSSLLLKRDTLFEKLEYLLDKRSSVEGRSELGNQLACRVCAILAEMWCLFRRTDFSSTKIEILGYRPDAHALKKFWKLCEEQLNNLDEDVNKDYAVIIAAAKLIATEAVPKEDLGPGFISHFVLHGTNVAEIVKHLITVLKKKDDDFLTIFLGAMKRAYDRHLVELSRSGNKSLTDKSFLKCKELAAKLSRTFVGAARNKYRTNILKFVEEGIEYAFVDAPKQLSFLEGAVLHFVSKLPTSDVLDILKDVEKRTENINTDEDPSGWRPYNSFVKSLRDKYTKN